MPAMKAGATQAADFSRSAQEPSVDDVRGHQAGKSAARHSEIARRFIHDPDRAFGNAVGGLEASVLRDPTGAAGGFPSARGGYQRNIRALSLGGSQRAGQDGMDRSLDRSRQSKR